MYQISKADEFEDVGDICISRFPDDLTERHFGLYELGHR